MYDIEYNKYIDTLKKLGATNVIMLTQHSIRFTLPDNIELGKYLLWSIKIDDMFANTPYGYKVIKFTYDKEDNSAEIIFCTKFETYK